MMAFLVLPSLLGLVLAGAPGRATALPPLALPPGAARVPPALIERPETASQTLRPAPPATDVSPQASREVPREFLGDRIRGGWVGMLIGGLEGLPLDSRGD